MACRNNAQRKTVFCIMEQFNKANLLNKINSIEKALMVLMVFREGQPSWGVRELSAHLGFSPSTIQRILQILKAYGFIRQDPKHATVQSWKYLSFIFPCPAGQLPNHKNSHAAYETAPVPDRGDRIP